MKLGDIERVIVVGLGLHGEAATEALLEEGIEVVVTEEDDTPALQERAASLIQKGAEVQFGTHDPQLLKWADLIVPSPGVPPFNRLIDTAGRIGLKVWSEIELAWRLCEAPIVAVTGTNGKTTTTALVNEMLLAGGVTSVTAGNNWTPLVEVARTTAADSVIVCEVSSFQLAFIEKFHPVVAIVLNVADDHHDWHADRESYVTAKARITENQNEDDLLLFKASDEDCGVIASHSSARLGAFDPDLLAAVAGRCRSASGRDPSVVGGVEDGRLFIDLSGDPTPLARIENIRLRGVHNIDNVLAATLAACELGVDVYAAARTIEGFEGLPHRASWVAEIDGVTYIDDSKATNPHATLRALEGLEDVVLIAGGRAKGLDLSPLASAKKRLVGAVVMGEAAADLEVILAGIPVRRAADIEEAVEIAASMALPGNTVLLSPAAASLDQYANYAERGERFVKAVLSR